MAVAPSAGKEVVKDAEARKVQRLLEDEEVAWLRRLQARIQLFDTKAGRLVPLPELLRPGGGLYTADVVCIGELHDSEAEHAMQRLLLDSLTYVLFLELRRGEGVDASAPRGKTPQNQSPQKVALGVEYFTRQQQKVLDKLIFGREKVTGDAFREAVAWDIVWNYDWAQYAPLFRFCQLNVTRIVGANLPYEANKLVSRGGLQALPEWLRESLPGLDLGKRRHRQRFESMLKMPIEQAVAESEASPQGAFVPNAALDNFYLSQVLWDEYMADTARRYLQANGGRMVLLAGKNHTWRDAIPDRIERNSKASGGAALRAVSVVPWRVSTADLANLPKGTDYLLPMLGPGGGEELAAEVAQQRTRLRGQPRVFPAGFL